MNKDVLKESIAESNKWFAKGFTGWFEGVNLIGTFFVVAILAQVIGVSMFCEWLDNGLGWSSGSVVLFVLIPAIILVAFQVFYGTRLFDTYAEKIKELKKDEKIDP